MVAKCLDLNKPWPMAQKKKKKKNDKVNMNSFPVHDCTQEQNSGPYFSSIVRQCKWPSLSRKIVKIQIMILPPWQRDVTLLLSLEEFACCLWFTYTNIANVTSRKALIRLFQSSYSDRNAKHAFQWFNGQICSWTEYSLCLQSTE